MTRRNYDILALLHFIAQWELKYSGAAMKIRTLLKIVIYHLRSKHCAILQAEPYMLITYVTSEL